MPSHGAGTPKGAWNGGWLMFLVDTNVWLEVLLEQENAEEARHFLQHNDNGVVQSNA